MKPVEMKSWPWDSLDEHKTHYTFICVPTRAPFKGRSSRTSVSKTCRRALADRVPTIVCSELGVKHKSNHSMFAYPFLLKNKSLQIILFIIDQDALLMRTYQNCRAPGLVRARPDNSIGGGEGLVGTKSEILAFRRFGCFGCFGCHSSNLAIVRCLVPNCLTLFAKNWDLGLWNQEKDACRSDQIFWACSIEIAFSYASKGSYRVYRPTSRNISQHQHGFASKAGSKVEDVQVRDQGSHQNTADRFGPGSLAVFFSGGCVFWDTCEGGERKPARVFSVKPARKMISNIDYPIISHLSNMPTFFWAKTRQIRGADTPRGRNVPGKEAGQRQTKWHTVWCTISICHTWPRR